MKPIQTKQLPFKVTHYKSLSSSNDYIKAHWNAMDNYSVVVCEHQSKGRGRNLRHFVSSAGKGLYMSILLKNVEAMQLAHCSGLVGVCVAQAIRNILHLPVQIKWVNDLYLEDKKIGGILCESLWNHDMQNVSYLCIGIGLNVFHQEFDDTLTKTAASLQDYCDVPKDCKQQLLDEILSQLSYHLNHPFEYLDIYRSYSCVIGRDVLITTPKESFVAFALAIESNGGLLIQKKDFTLHTLISGEIHLSALDSIDNV